MLPNLIFQLCGLQSFVARGSSLASSLALLWCVANVLLYATALAFCFIERRWLFVDRRNRGINFIPFIKCSITIVAHLVVLIEALLARNAYRAFGERLTRVDGTLEKLTTSGGDILRQAERRYRNKLLLFMTFVCATELAILRMVYPDPVQQAIWCLTVSSLIVTRMKHLHHAHHIDRLTARFVILREQLERLCDVGTPSANEGHLGEQWLPGGIAGKRKNELDVLHRPSGVGYVPMTACLKGQASLQEAPSDRTAGSLQAEHLRRMFLVKGTYLALWHAGKDLNGCCVYSQLANLLQNFIQCTCDLYSMYSLLYLNQFEDIFGFILSVVATFAALGIVLAACENCKNQVGQMGQLLHKRHGDEGDWLAKMVENFSLLLQHTPIYFSLGGFFDMDFILLKEMAAAITTYMVIFIQFMPKDESAIVDATVGNTTMAVVPISTSTISTSSTQ
ncbi:AGAP009855-PA-like protein [Anopheles sinensis]|uniref:Gustatory receptor n=1 Tax=Anopheles sinensis TaxID=74873 RepID=A0A084W8X8_ANOSI|nr:AGAP009855-PA-like protein [Anopheles sinensis]